MMEWLKKYWPFALLVVGISAAVSIGKWGAAPVDESQSAASATSAPAEQSALQREFEQAMGRQDGGASPEVAKRTADEILNEHRAALEGDLPPDEAAARLSALGNLHKQKKRDYETAARYFEELIQNYPDWAGIRGVYHQLMSCYTQLEDHASLRLLYRKMIEVFPEESNEYQYANDALGNS